MTATISPSEARDFLLDHLGLRSGLSTTGAAGVRELLLALGCIQLDPLDALGTNADLVALARIDGIEKGDVYRHLMPGYAFEHFAKERCLIPAHSFPYYRDQAVETPWWRQRDRLLRLPPNVVEEVLAEVRERGPLTSAELTDRGGVKSLDWNGWKGTGKVNTMVLEVLWARCQVVVCGRRSSGKVYDVPDRALPEAAQLPGGDFDRYALLERVRSAGLLARAGGAHWSMLYHVRKTDLADRLIEEGLIEEVRVDGSRRPYLAPAGWRERPSTESDDRLRILGPLDPLIWDRKLIKHIFDFEYIWEVYKPKAKRRWGWYVCPLLHRGEFVGRIEARLRNGALVVENLWGTPERPALLSALERHAEACGAGEVTGI